MRTTDMELAAVWRRIAAFMCDYVVIAVYLVLLSVGFALLPRELVEWLFATPTSGQAVAFVTLTLPVVLYFSGFEASRWGATPGKRMLGLRVTRSDGRRLSVMASLLRSGIKFLPWELAHTAIWRIEGWPQSPEPPTGWPLLLLVVVWVLLGVSVLMLLRSARRQALHDAVAGSVVCRARAQMPGAGPGEAN